MGWFISIDRPCKTGLGATPVALIQVKRPPTDTAFITLAFSRVFYVLNLLQRHAGLEYL